MSTLAQMKADAVSLGIALDVSWKHKRDLLFPIRKANLNLLTSIISNIKAHELVLGYESPMLCLGYWNLKVEEQDSIWFPENEWIVEEKFDGCRCFVVYVPGEGWSVFSRDYNEASYLFKDWTSRLLIPWVERGFSKAFVLDCELLLPLDSTVLAGMGVGGQSKEDAMKSILEMGVDFALQYQMQHGHPKFHAFDIIHFDGHDLRGYDLQKRKVVLSKVMEALNNQGIDIVHVQGERLLKTATYESILAKDGEGVVAKNLKSVYQSNFTRKSNWWVKIKNSQNLDIRKGKIVGFVSGYGISESSKDCVDSLKISVKLKYQSGLEGVHEVADITNMPLDFKRSISSVIDGKVYLVSPMYNVPVEIEGWDFNSMTKRFRHARLIRFNPINKQVVIDESDLVKYTSI